MKQTPLIEVRQLESGYWLLRGQGPCNFSQPPRWPAGDEALIRAHAFPEASEEFIRQAAKRTAGTREETPTPARKEPTDG